MQCSHVQRIYKIDSFSITTNERVSNNKKIQTSNVIQLREASSPHSYTLLIVFYPLKFYLTRAEPRRDLVIHESIAIP